EHLWYLRRSLVYIKRAGGLVVVGGLEGGGDVRRDGVGPAVGGQVVLGRPRHRERVAFGDAQHVRADAVVLQVQADPAGEARAHAWSAAGGPPGRSDPKNRRVRWARCAAPIRRGRYGTTPPRPAAGCARTIPARPASGPGTAPWPGPGT